MSVTTSSYKWHSAYRPFLFGVDSPVNTYTWIFSGVTNVNGKAKFTSSPSNTYGTPPGKYLYQPTGTYAGIHTIVDVDANGNILTDTDYISTATSITAKVVVNYIYRIHYGYPTQDNYVDVKPVWRVLNGSASLVADLSTFIKALFRVQPPVEGYDENMYTHVRVEIKAATDYAEFLTNAGLVEADVIQLATGYDWQDDANIWYFVNGVLPNAQLYTDHLGGGDVLAAQNPITFANDCTIFSKIINSNFVLNNRVYNVITCNSSSCGIGCMVIGSTFIVS